MFNVHSNLNIHTWRWCNVTIGLRSQLFTVSHCSVFEMRAPHARASVITFAWISHILLSSPDYTRNVSRSTTTVLDVFTLNFVRCKYHMQWGETWDGYGSETLHVTDKDHWFSEFSQFMSRPYSNFHFPGRHVTGYPRYQLSSHVQVISQLPIRLDTAHRTSRM